MTHTWWCDATEPHRACTKVVGEHRAGVTAVQVALTQPPGADPIILLTAIDGTSRTIALPAGIVRQVVADLRHAVWLARPQWRR